MRISPHSPCATSRVGSSASTTFMYVLGKGTPIVPLRRLGAKGLPRQTGDASVIPYPSTSSPPETDSHSSTTDLSLIHISEPTRQAEISYAVFCLKKKKNNKR